jgi:hypothetical protein
MLLLVLGLLIVPLVVTRPLVAAAPFTLVAGIALTPMVSCQNTLVGVLAPPGAMVEAFTWVTAVMWAGISAGSAAAGSLVAVTGVGSAFLAASSAIAIAGLIALLGRRRIAATD